MGRSMRRAERLSVVVGVAVALVVVGGVLVPAFSEGDPTAPQTIPTPEGVPAQPGSAPFSGSADGVSAENVLGPDDRVRVTPTTEFPARAVGWLRMLWGHDDEGDPIYGRCTGSMIGPRTVLTAAHCIYRSRPGRFPIRTTFFPGRDGGITPYGSCRAVRHFILPAYPDGERDENDIGAVKLNCNIGQTTGWFGVVGGVDWTDDTIYLRGYPDSRGDGDQQWLSEGRITATLARYVRHTADATVGESGSAIYCLYDPPGSLPYGHYISAVHVSGGRVRNYGARITRARVGTIADWRAA